MKATHMSANPNTTTISNEQAEAILAQLKNARITLTYIESRIKNREFINPPSNPQLTLCVLTFDNGFCAVGEAAPASPANFNAELGQKYAYDNAIKKMWPAFGFTLCEVLRPREPGIPLAGLGDQSTSSVE